MMRSTWSLQGAEVLPLGEWEIEDVLLEFNGPQLVILRSTEGTQLAVAADEDSQAERWLKAPLSSAEREALLEGALPIGDIFQKEKVAVVDLSRETGRPVREWRVEPGRLDPQDLPSPAAVLAESEIQRRASVSPKLLLERPSDAARLIRLDSLGDIFKHFQRLWNAIAQAVEGPITERGTIHRDLLERASLSVSRLSPGSAEVDLAPQDQDLFRTIGARYATLVAASRDEHGLARELRGLQVRVRSTYRDLLDALNRHGLQAYTKWDRERVFIGQHVVRQAKSILESSQQVAVEEMSTSGYFTAINLRNGSFELVDAFDSETYSGSVAPRAFEEESVVVGPRARYEVKLSVLITPDMISAPSTRYQLLSARQPDTV